METRPRVHIDTAVENIGSLFPILSLKNSYAALILPGTSHFRGKSNTAEIPTGRRTGLIARPAKCEGDSFRYKRNHGHPRISQSKVVFRWMFPLIEAQQWKTLQKSCMGGHVGFPGKDTQGLPERNPTFGWQIVRRAGAKVAWVSGQQCTETTSSRGHCQA